MRKRGLAILMALITTIIAMSFSAGCHKEEWWEDWSEIDVEFSDPLATPDTFKVNLKDEENLKNIKFTYTYDEEEHFPKAKVMVNGEEKGYVETDEKKVYIVEEGKYNSTPIIKYPGKYFLYYEFYATEDTTKMSFCAIKVYIIII